MSHGSPVDTHICLSQDCTLAVPYKRRCVRNSLQKTQMGTLGGTQDRGFRLVKKVFYLDSFSLLCDQGSLKKIYHNVNGTSSNLITKFSFLYFEWGFAYCVDRSGRSILQYSCSCQWSGRRSHCWGMDSLVHNQAHIFPVDRLHTQTHTMGW